MNLKYVVQDAKGKVLGPEATESFWDICQEARIHARALRQDVFIKSDDPDDVPFLVKFYGP